MNSVFPRQLLPFLWITILTIPSIVNAQSTLLLPFRQNDLWGFADKNRQLVIPAVYEQVSFFRDSVFGCCRLPIPYAVATGRDSTWLIGKDGKPLFSGFLRHHYIDLHPFGNELLVLNTPSGAFILNYSLNLLRFLPDKTIHTYPYSWFEREGGYPDIQWGNGMYSDDWLCGNNFTQSPVNWSRVSLGPYYQLTDVPKKRNGLIGQDGQDVIPALYKELSNIWQGLLVADDDIIDTTGNVIIHSPYHLFPCISNEGLIQVKDTLTQRRGFVNTKGKIIIALQFLRAYGFYKGLAFCQQADSTWILINPKGQTVLPVFPDPDQKKNRFVRVGRCHEAVQIDQGLVWSDKYLFVRQADHYWHCFDWKLQELSTLPLDTPPLQVDWRGLKGYLGTRDGMSVFFDTSWQLLLAPHYQYIDDANPSNLGYRYRAKADLLIGENDGQKVLLDRNFQRIGEVEQYPNFEIGKCGYIFRNNGKYGAIDSSGIHRIEPIYDYLSPLCTAEKELFRLGDYFACKDGRCGAIKKDGSVGMPFVFRDIPRTLRYYADISCDPLDFECYVDSLRGKWYFFNTRGVFREFPDSIIAVVWGTQNEYNSLLAYTAQNKFQVDRYDGTLKPLSGKAAPPAMVRLAQTIDDLTDQQDLKKKPLPDIRLMVEPAGDSLVYAGFIASNGYNNQGALFNANGHLLLDSLTQIHCQNGIIDYFQDGYYRQWDVPLLGRYTLRTSDYSAFDKFIIDAFTCNWSDTNTYAYGIFLRDGTCILPARCGQKVELDYNTRLYIVSFEGRKTLFDAESKEFRIPASHYLPYMDSHQSQSEVPPGYFWIEINHKPGLIRIADGAPFFGEE